MAAIFRFADVEVREREFSLTKAGERLAVEPKAFRVLLILLRNPGKLIPKEELLNAVWGDAAVTENSLTRAVALLRKLLGDEAHSPRFIETVATVGYRFLGSVEAVEDPAAPRVAFDSPTSREPQVTGDAPPASGPTKDQARRRMARTGILVPAAIAAILFTICIWFLSRPLPPPRVTAYDQVTHDGHIGGIAGTDGSRIYFNMYPWGPIAQVGVTGGDIVTIPTGSIRALAVGTSADGGSLLIGSWGPNRLWTMGTLGGPPHLVADASGKSNHSWSPDGKLIAYSEIQGRNLLVMGSDGTGVHQVATAKGDITDIAWSPDGGRIRLTVDDALWEVASTGGNLQPLFPAWKGPPGQCCGRWTPDGAMYMFLAGGNNYVGPMVGGFEQIWVLDERQGLLRRAGRKPVQLTSGPMRWHSLVPSRDGGKVFATGTTARGELVRFDSKSNEFQPFLGGISAESVSFSRDGSQIAYITYPDGILWRAKANGTERVQLTSPPLYPILCRWSPDGTQILFTAQRGVSRYAIYTVAAQGGNPQRVIPADDGIGQVDGNWSPDGHRIVYHVDPHSVYIFDADTGQATKIPGGDGLWSPRCSPDGRSIAAMTTPPVTIKLFDLQAQRWSMLTENTGPWGYPTWSHDGKYIYALNFRGKWSVQRISIPDGKISPVVDLSNVHLVGAAAFWFGLDPNDAPLTLRNHGTSDIYALTLER